ncbi:hypothetical protein [Alicyclobacillus sp. SO9]|uniref:hypothetical protein n=1 Tax=Alicyclobacillus sp. SO9 TaxID=2665646 RepID=UPI0018E72CEB|nr:hypothetical protein [Alicyclobacillus sp. SO9]QQE79170.1 hypothetical protein GI364_01230 [Alicyclobacillus sp. SO9]
MTSRDVTKTINSKASQPDQPQTIQINPRLAAALGAVSEFPPGSVPETGHETGYQTNLGIALETDRHGASTGRAVGKGDGSGGSGDSGSTDSGGMGRMNDVIDGGYVPVAKLPSVYAEVIQRRQHQIQREYPENKHRVECRRCGHRDWYDIGFIMIDPQTASQKKEIEFDDVHQSDELQGESTRSEFERNLYDGIQFTGYFRCTHCNSGNDWAVGKDFILYLTTAVMKEYAAIQAGQASETLMARLGTFHSSDGYKPKSAMDSEDHLLDVIEQKPGDAYLWNRLGNIYKRGGTPVLAAVAFEQSLRYDSGQVESHLSLANILYQIGEFEACIRHSHLALVHARFYKSLDPAELHGATCVILRNLLDISMMMGNLNLFVPPHHLIDEAYSQHGQPALAPGSDVKQVPDVREFDLQLDNPGSFSELADLYMGSKRKSRLSAASKHHKHKNKNKKKRKQKR